MNEIISILICLFLNGIINLLFKLKFRTNSMQILIISKNIFIIINIFFFLFNKKKEKESASLKIYKNIQFNNFLQTLNEYNVI